MPNSNAPVRAPVDHEGRPANLAEVMRLPLTGDWSLACTPKPEGVSLTLSHPERAPFQLEIALTQDGPVIRASAAALHLDASHELTARCDHFSIEARSSVAISAPKVAIVASDQLGLEGGRLEAVASRGDMRLRANDDVQVLGERVLLNCERELPLPRWLADQQHREAVLPRQDLLGDLALDLLEAPELEAEEP